MNKNSMEEAIKRKMTICFLHRKTASWVTVNPHVCNVEALDDGIEIKENGVLISEETRFFPYNGMENVHLQWSGRP